MTLLRSDVPKRVWSVQKRPFELDREGARAGSGPAGELALPSLLSLRSQ